MTRVEEIKIKIAALEVREKEALLSISQLEAKLETLAADIKEAEEVNMPWEERARRMIIDGSKNKTIAFYVGKSVSTITRLRKKLGEGV